MSKGQSINIKLCKHRLAGESVYNYIITIIIIGTSMFKQKTSPAEQTQTTPSIHRKITLSIDTDSFVLTGGNDIVGIDLDTGNLSVKGKEKFIPKNETKLLG